MAQRPDKRADGQALVDRLAATIRSRVQSGEIEVGSWLRQETLAAEFGVSRTPIREALRKLQANGIVEVKPHRGALVRGPTGREIRDAYEVRAELEGLAADLASSRIDDRGLEDLHDAQAMFRQAVEAIVERGRRRRSASPPRGDWARANDRFHEAILAAAGNEPLLAIVQELHRRFPRDLTWAALSGNSSLLEQNVNEHARVLEAVEARDAAEARARMVAHVRGAGELIARQLEQRG
jgi:DNA-binding GntR family transcriptional regulator